MHTEFRWGTVHRAWPTAASREDIPAAPWPSDSPPLDSEEEALGSDGSSDGSSSPKVKWRWPDAVASSGSIGFKLEDTR